MASMAQAVNMSFFMKCRFKFLIVVKIQNPRYFY